MKEKFEMMKRLMNLVKRDGGQKVVSDLSEAQICLGVRSAVRSSKGAGEESVGQRPSISGQR